MTDALSPLRSSRRDRIVSLAQQAFVQSGFRATSMEGLAQAAGVSKATLYSYFPDKDAVFVAVADHVAFRLINAVEAALASDAATVQQRVRAALTDKHRIVHDLVRQSPHAAELFAAKTRLRSVQFVETDSVIENAIAKALAQVSRNPQELAALLLSASQGIANAAQDFQTTEDRIAQLCVLIPNGDAG
ncbi:TetR/AcrR family transcriptional regulator [Sulfitobacter sp. M368]|uniref:TetR/AcrR family transcriptional regulator n=1 Tax=Sulfitobacter sp. M368 TaxID=2867021 RepID=UPI0021A46168|nr:TetR/AcrR family transcriptional regulator [Sulfitobacter sp. M368]UWR14022.1 TetR/AcrR family transcriptional regulator [Sulfitobacter sp. M368]